MAYASISGRASTDPRNPKAFGVCDRCGLWYNLEKLQWQFSWRGNELINTRRRVCAVTCLDVPFQLNRPLNLPADPAPVDQPRTEQFAIDEQYVGWDQSNEFWDGLPPNWDPTNGNAGSS